LTASEAAQSFILLAQPLSIKLFIQPAEIWLPTALGWLVLFGSLGLSGLLFLRKLYAFLAVNAPIQADLLVVDGWLPDYALERVYTLFQTGSYRQIVTVGTPINRGHYLIEYKTYADVAAATLITLGVPATQIVSVPVPVAARYRTHCTAAALSQWLTAEPRTQSIDLCTLGAHARRSHLLFRRNLAPRVTVGIISLEPLEYDSSQWWQCSAGARVVIAELIGYLYTRLCLPWMTSPSNATK
jgi:hypothetical protein